MPPVRTVLLAALAAVVAAAPVVALTAPAGATTPFDPDAGVRLNQIQTVGTHNSYHVENTPTEKRVRDRIRPGTGTGSEQYTHPAVGVQFALEKVRSVEFDLVRDPDGGRFADPLLRRLAGEGAWFPSVMSRPGTKVLHEEDVDYRTNCLTFVQCLQQVKQWSDAHRGAIPLTILLQFDDGPGPTFTPYTVQPLLPWTKQAMVDEAEHEVLGVFGRERLITPDDVRTPGRTLHDSVATTGWPTLARSRGKVLFAMDNDRDTYVAGNPNLEQRLFFTNAQSDPTAADGAFAIRDEATDLQPVIQGMVRSGMLIRSRADTPQVQATSGDTTRRDAAFASGAQVVSTDYPLPGSALRWGTDYHVTLPGPLPARCNPVNAPRGCSSLFLERP